MKKLTLSIILLSSMAWAQNPNRSFQSYKKVQNGVEVKTNDGTYYIQPYSEKIVETSFVPNGQQAKDGSHAVIMKPQSVSSKIKDSKKELVIETKGLKTVINKAPFQVKYYYKDKLVTSEKLGYQQVNDSTEAIQFNLTKDEALYGAGARVLGMNRRGNRLELYNRAHYGYETESKLMNFTMPIAISSNQYMIHFDNAPIGFLDFDSKKTNELTYETISGNKKYQVVVGDSWADMVSNYTNLTGKQEMLPRWAMGNIASRMGYHDQAEVKFVVDKFRRDSIPLDGIILDLYWFGKTVQGTMGNLDWDKDNFNRPDEMIAYNKKQGVKTVLITEPFILTTSSKWNEAVNADILAKTKDGKPFTYDFYFGNTGLIDIFKPEAKTWFWNVYKKFINQGIDGWWGDLGEPEVHPKALQHINGSADEVHNIYGSEWAKLVYDGYKTDFPEQRPFILMRSAYSGAQRYGMIPWSGDVNRTWGGLYGQTEISLQMGMQGIPYMHSDLGGFAGNYEDDELYTRWLQYGVFQPIYRPHAQEDVPSEPIFKNLATKALAKQAIELRYQLIPYNYTLVYENSISGQPLMRPLFFEDDSNKELLNISTTYFWGKNFLVSPIVEKGLKMQKVHFPKGFNWFDFYTDEKVKGGQVLEVETKTAYIPTYVRGGSFIPMAKLVQTTEDYNLDEFEVHYFFDEEVKQSSDYMYNDDGKTPNAVEKGLFEKINFTSKVEKSSVKIEIATEKGKNYQGSKKKVKLVIHNAPANLKLNQGLKGTYDATKKQFIVEVALEAVGKSQINFSF